ncbi:MAG: YbhB/YbcL family Raf kinase inhibitor-like protein [Spirochaetota bacterium]|nr:MAG: YbhB/YbcL family Raf kinase inhibitor-like protein [Spirochaetota bacterium]
MRRASGILCFILMFMLAMTLSEAEDNRKGEDTMSLNISSEAFSSGGMIPTKYTCDGADVSPPLSWSAGPEGTKSYALIADDPDAPVGTWVHWVIYDIPEDVTSLPEGVQKSKSVDNGADQGTNDFKKYGFGGPCPPGGTHRYYFKVYALDTLLGKGPGLTKKKLLAAMEGHILAQGELMGKYSR